MDCFFILYYPKYTPSKGSEQSILVHSFTLPSETENPSAALSLAREDDSSFFDIFVAVFIVIVSFIAVFNYGIIVMDRRGLFSVTIIIIC